MPETYNKIQEIKDLGDRQGHNHFVLKSEGIYPARERSRLGGHLCLRVFKTSFPSLQENALIICSCFQALPSMMYKILYFA